MIPKIIHFVWVGGAPKPVWFCNVSTHGAGSVQITR